MADKYQLDAQGRNHLWQQGDVLHACVGARIHDRDPGTYLVWTLCNRDVPANASFKSGDESVTCPKCLERISPPLTDKGAS